MIKFYKLNYIKTALFFCSLLFVKEIKASHELDSMFSINGYQQTAFVMDFLKKELYNDANFKAITNLIENKGSKSNKINLALALEMRSMAEKELSLEKQLASFKNHLPKAIESKDHFLIGRFYFNISQLYNAIGERNKGFENILYCLDELKKDPANNYYEQSYAVYSAAVDYYDFQDYEKAIPLATKAGQFEGKYTPNKDWFKKVNGNLLAMAYLKNANYDSATAWFNKVKAYAIADNDSSWLGIITGNLGSVQFLQNKCADAIAYFNEALPICTKIGLLGNVVSFNNYLAGCYLKMGNLPLALNYLNTNKGLFPKTIDQSNYNTNLIKYFSTLIEHSRLTNNATLIVQYTDSLNKYQNLLNKQFNTTKKAQDEAEIAYRNRELETKIKLHNAQLNSYVLFGLLATVALLSAVFILFFKRKNLKLTLKQEQLANDKLLAENELHQAQAAIKKFTKQAQEKNEIIERFNNEIALLKSKNIALTNNQTENIEALKKAAILTDDDWDTFKIMFEKLHPNFIKQLLLQHPTLTIAETRYLVFMKLELTPKEMSAMLGVGPEAIRNLRYRVKKKLEVANESDTNILVLAS